jgi:hypothetical protein
MRDYPIGKATAVPKGECMNNPDFPYHGVIEPTPEPTPEPTTVSPKREEQETDDDDMLITTVVPAVDLELSLDARVYSGGGIGGFSSSIMSGLLASFGFSSYSSGNIIGAPLLLTNVFLSSNDIFPFLLLRYKQQARD